uniref:MIF4G domain-containing protein n=1 Tax=Syphacia muris TaxID=451379 RepID=A0A0N5AUM2_9BILA
MDEEHVQNYVAEVKARSATQLAHRQLISDAVPLTEDALRKLDSTLKRTTAFMKKLRNLSTSQCSAIMADLEKINLSKYIEEMANSIAEAKLKLSDLSSVITICVKLSCLYTEFSQQLLLEFRRILPTKRSDKIQNPSKLRVDIRLATELCLHGVFGKEGIQMLGSVVSYLTLTDKNDHVNAPIITSLCKALGVDLLNIYPMSIQQEASKLNIQLFYPTVIPAEQKKVFAQLFLDYQKTMMDHLRRELNEVNRLTRSVKRQLRTRGDASAEDFTNLEEAKGRYDKQLQSAITLSEVLGTEIESMEAEQSEDEEEEISTQQLGRALEEGTVSVWPDEDTRQFYESRMELRQMVPAILFEESEQRTLEPVGGAIEDVDVTGLEDIIEVDEDQETEAEEEEEPLESSSEVVEAADKLNKISGQTLKLMMNSFLEQLPWLINRDLIDKAALDFVTNLNTRNNRRKLCQVMLEQHCDRLDLLPFYGRLVATLEPVMPDLAVELSQSLIQQFRSIVRTKSKLRVDKKVRCCRFISELTKFGIIPKAQALTCLRMVLFDFRGANIDMCCAMIDAMGQFLYLSVDSHGKMKVLLEVMMKKRAHVRDFCQQMLIDNAYYTCVPPEKKEQPVFRRPPIHDFIRFLIVNISRSRVDTTVRCLRKIDWEDENISDKFINLNKLSTKEYAINCLSSPWLLKYNNLQYLASTIAVLDSTHDFIGVRVVDNILEVIRLSLESHTQAMNQRTLLAVVFLGQLYNYITLYQLITFGAYDPLVDDWNNLTRIRYVCELLLTCGEYYNGGAAKKKLDCFLVFFYRYYMAKVDAFKMRDIPFPNEITFCVQEMSDFVRKGIKIPETLAEAQAAVNVLHEKYKQAIDHTLNDEERNETEEEEEAENRRSKIDVDEKNIGGPTTEEEFSSSDEVGNASFFDESENVRVHTNRVKLPEDEKFERQLEQMVSETMQSRPIPVTTPLSEIVVPTAARQKFHRVLAFVENGNTSSGSSSNCEREAKMAMLTRGKGNKAILKAITMATPSNLVESWSAQQEQERQELSLHKRITLTMNERMAAEENSD